MMNLELLEILACPLSGGSLVFMEELNELWSKDSGHAYPVMDDIPIMLVEESRKLSSAELEEIR